MIGQGSSNAGMMAINNQLLCNKDRHDNMQLNYVCISNGCINKGLVCQNCVREQHKDHNVQQLKMFLNTYKESCQLSHALPTLKRDSKILQEVQQELSHYLDTFAKSLQDVVLEAKKRILANIECDHELIDSVLQVEQKHADGLEELEQQLIASPNEAQEKILQLISRLKNNFGNDTSSRFTVSSFREDNQKTILLLMRKNNSIKNNIFQETPKFTKDLYMYLKQIDSALEAYDTKRTNFSHNINNQSQIDLSVTNRSVSPLQGYSYSNSFQPNPPQQYESSPTRSASGSRVNIFARQPASNRNRQTEEKRDDSNNAQKAIQSSTTNIFNIQEQFYPNRKDSNNTSMVAQQQKSQAPNSIIPVSYSSNKKQQQQQQQNGPQSQFQQQQQLQQQQQIIPQQQAQQQQPQSEPILIQQQFQVEQSQSQQQQLPPQTKQTSSFQSQNQQPQQEQQVKQDQYQSPFASQTRPQQQQQTIQQQQEQLMKQDQLQQSAATLGQQMKQQQQILQQQQEQMQKQDQQQKLLQNKQQQQPNQQQQSQLQSQQQLPQQQPATNANVTGSGNYKFSSRPQSGSNSNSPFPKSGQKQNIFSKEQQNQNIPSKDLYNEPQQGQAQKMGSNPLIASVNIKDADTSNISQNDIRASGYQNNTNQSKQLNRSDNKLNQMNIYSDIPLTHEDFNKHLQNQIKPASPPKEAPQGLQINSSSPLLNNFNQGKNRQQSDNFINKSHISYMQSQHSPNSRVNTVQNGGSKSQINITNSPASNTSFLDLSRVAYNQIQQSALMAHDGKIKAIELMGNDKIASGGEDKLIKIWERTEYKLLNNLEGHNASVTVIKYHNMSRILASGGEDDLVIVWKPVPLLSKVHVLKGHDDTITCITFQNERTLISSSKDMKLIIWDIEKGIGKNKLDQSDTIINDIAIYNKMIMCVSDKYVQFWELSSYKLMKKVEAHDDIVNQISLIHRKRRAQIYIVTCGNDGCVYVWDGDNKYDEVDKIQEDQIWNIKCFDYNSHYDLIVYGCNSKVESLSKVVVYSLEQKKVTQTISHYTNPINQIKCIYKDIYIALENSSIDNVKIQKNQSTIDY